MAKIPVDFGEWRPDIATLDTKFAAEVENVFAGVNNYLPFPSLLPFSATALPAAAKGLFAARTTGGEWKIYAGTATKLYTWSLGGWVDVSRLVGGAYAVAADDLWSFAQFGTRLIAVHAADVPQYIDVDAGANFALLPGSPPRATNVAVIGDFVVLSRLESLPTGIPTGNPRRMIIWSGINNSEQWIPGTNLCDTQEFPDNGSVQGVAGSEIGYVVQDRAIRTMQFLPGDTTFIFNFSRVLSDRGCISKYGFTTIGNNLYFVSEDGFYSITGQQVTPIGQDKVNEWFLANSDADRRDAIVALAGVNKPYIVWVFHASSASPMYDRQIIFNWSNARWTHSNVSAQIWGLLASVNLDLDTTGAEPNDVDLDSTARSLDSFAYVGGRPLIGAIDPNGFLATLQGPNLQATMETAEVHLAPGTRAFVSEAYPLDDAVGGPGTLAAGTRERLQDATTFGTPVGIEITGSAALFSSSRLHRFRRTIPAASVWTHAQGVLVEAQQDGTVA